MYGLRCGRTGVQAKLGKFSPCQMLFCFRAAASGENHREAPIGAIEPLGSGSSVSKYGGGLNAWAFRVFFAYFCVFVAYVLRVFFFRFCVLGSQFQVSGYMDVHELKQSLSKYRLDSSFRLQGTKETKQ